MGRAGAMLVAGLFAMAANGESVPIDQPGFEAVGKWKRSDTGGPAENIHHLPSNSLGALVDEIPDGGEHLAYSNGVPAHSIYQVLTATLAPSTAYTIRIVAIDRVDTDFSPFELRLGYVPGEDEGTGEQGLANDHFGRFLLKPVKTFHPAPFNRDKADDGYNSWTTTFVTKERPSGLGRPLRIEIVGRGVQSLYDNVQLEAHALPVVVMLGDSTTDQGLPWVVKKQLDERIKPLLERPIMINAGKGGDRAPTALERLEKDVLVHQPDIVTVSFGLNDAGVRKPGEYGESLRKVVRTLKAAGIEVVLMTSTPFNNERHFWAKQEEYKKLGGLDEYMDREFCERVRTIAAEEAVVLCDLHAIFSEAIEKEPKRIDSLISPDGVHLTGEGLDLVALHIAPILHELLAVE